MWAVEDDCRDMAKKFKNCYVFAVFACCRELYSQVKHRGGFSGDLKQAKVHFADKNELLQRTMLNLSADQV